MKRLGIVLIAILAIAVMGGWYWAKASSPRAEFKTVAVEKGDLVATISATGTVEPQEVVDVGAQIAGMIDSFGKDPQNANKLVDYGTHVEEGTVLAHIDESLFKADVDSAQAAVDQAIANVTKAKADLVQMKANFAKATADWNRAQEAAPGVLSKLDIDAYRAAYETAQANVGVGEATIVQTEKAVNQAQAALNRAKTNLGYCTITSPVKGVIIDRRVNMGQTVVASLSAPSLFLIAKDLTKMQVWASVNEADIGNIKSGQPVTFTVDAFPNRNFHGTVGKIRLNAQMTQNVVTYTVEVETDNSDGTLLPYLTANLQFETAKRTDVLKVPVAALRWTPTREQISPDAKQDSQHGDQQQHSEGQSHNRGRVWVADGDHVKPISVTTGLSDGAFTEVSGDGIDENTQIVVGTTGGAQASAGGATNPFVPQFRRQGQGSGQQRAR